jgi:hypothetical protein
VGNFLGNYRRRMTGVAIVSCPRKCRKKMVLISDDRLGTGSEASFNPKVPGSSPGRPTSCASSTSGHGRSDDPGRRVQAIRRRRNERQVTRL